MKLEDVTFLFNGGKREEEKTWAAERKESYILESHACSWSLINSQPPPITRKVAE